MKDTDVQIHCGCGADENRPGPQACRKGRQCVVVIPEDDLFRIVMALPEFKRRYTVSERNLEIDEVMDEPLPDLSALPKAGEKIDSTSDERVTNNVMRHEYKVLSDQEKSIMKTIKDYGLDFHSLLCEMEASQGHSRELSLAKTKIEEAVMWAVKHVTG